MNSQPASTSDESHWVESLFPPGYSIADYRSTFQADNQRVRRYITTLSSFDAPTLAAIYEQSYLFSLVQRLAKQEEENEDGRRKNRNKSNQTQPVDSVLDIRLIKAFLEKHKQTQVKQEIDPFSENIWSSDEIGIIRSAYIKIRDDCLRLKSENDYYREQMANLQEKLEETNKNLEELRQEHFSLKKTHARWTLKSNSAEQMLNQERKERKELEEHLKKLNEINENLRQNQLEMRSVFLEKQTKLEHLESQIEHYDRTLKNDFERRMEMMEKRIQVDKDRFDIEKHQLKSELDKEHDLRRQNLLALDQLRKHVALSNLIDDGQSTCNIKLVKYV